MKSIIIAILFASFLSCGQKVSGTFEYQSLIFDTSKITIFSYDTSLYSFPKYSTPLPLTNEDIILADSFLTNAVNKFNGKYSRRFYEAFGERVSIDNFIINLSKYRQQYFPYKDGNGQRMLEVICFCRAFPQWRTKEFVSSNGDGLSTFTLRINLSTRQADNIVIGSFG
ncbi:MAG TPA: hypothetical protein VG738_00605 [Chitinophagaceae bacterium]|nr:hypothetical protein [Chitinophagaceae bacterium]